MKRLWVWLLAFAVAASCAAASAEAMLARLPLSGLTPAALGNVVQAAAAIDGYYLPRGGCFSFNEATGARTEARGYLEAEDASGELVPGGGACQAATAIYRALSAGQANVEYASLYFSADGSVRVDDAENLDFSFYNYDADMVIELYADNEAVNCSITFSASEDAWNTGSALIGRACLRVAGTESLRGNVELACGSINDTTLCAGDRFSFNEIVGPCTREYGYLAAPNGAGMEALGGGVDEVASALYLAVKDLDCVSVAEKTTYGSRYNQNYVSGPQDAVLVDYAAGVDFSFSYDGNGYLAIYIWLENGELVCEVYETTSW